MSSLGAQGLGKRGLGAPKLVSIGRVLTSEGLAAIRDATCAVRVA